jgi:hypothetical protein
MSAVIPGCLFRVFVLSCFRDWSFILGCYLLAAGAAHADTAKVRITGLFMKEREEDLRAVVAKIPQVKLVSIDYEQAEASFAYDPAKAFPGVKPADFVQQLDNLVKSASNHTFGVKPLSTVPRDQLRRVEIAATALDCRACCLAAYETVMRLDGVDRATASFREGRVIAWIDPTRVDQARIEDVLRKLGVDIGRMK